MNSHSIWSGPNRVKNEAAAATRPETPVSAALRELADELDLGTLGADELHRALRGIERVHALSSR